MSDQDALLDAIREHPDEDTPRLAYADWLDEHAPDTGPSPARGPSARADYIRVQCALAGRPYDSPEYPALLELEEELARWLDAHAGSSHPELPDDLEWTKSFSYGADESYRRGFPEEVEYTDYDEEPEENVERITVALEEAFTSVTIRSLRLGDAYGAEIEGLANNPVSARLRGLFLDYIADDDEAAAVRGIVGSEHLTGLRRLGLEFPLSPTDARALAQAQNLGALESLALDEMTPAGMKTLSAAKWFRGLRALRLWMNNRDTLRALSELPPMPHLVELELAGEVVPTVAAVRRLVAADSFPRLARLDLERVHLTPEMFAVLARAPWPLRHLRVSDVAIRKAGAEALAGAAFAGSLRVLELRDCKITAGGVQTLAGAPALAGLRHLTLHGNPIGPGGLTALARSPHLRGLRLLDLSGCNGPKAALDTAAVQTFLAALNMPELRHLMMNGLPVGVRGARTIAAGGTFANLTRLGLDDCGLRESGAQALCESTALPGLTVLDLRANNAGKGLAKLASPKVFPRLGHCDLLRNRVPKPLLTKLGKRPALQV
ncbi:MAG TPA: TIGR02996 domain-containing protein [Gemmata sp.]